MGSIIKIPHIKIKSKVFIIDIDSNNAFKTEQNPNIELIIIIFQFYLIGNVLWQLSWYIEWVEFDVDSLTEKKGLVERGCW